MTPLTAEQVENKMTWQDVIRYYKPDATEEEIEYLLWNETCYPFSDETTLRQINNYFKNQSHE
jgi:hypothetical protein